MTTHDASLPCLTNPIITPTQLSTSSSELDGVPADLESSLRHAGALLTQAAGILLHIPQNLIAQAVTIFCRFFTGPEGGSFRLNGIKDISSASLYLTLKPSSHPVSPRSLLNVYAYLTSPSSPLSATPSTTSAKLDPESYYLSENTYTSQKLRLFASETTILRTISFQTHFVAPHHLALTYMQTLSLLPQPPTSTSTRLAGRALEHLNTALLSPQLLYLTHQPTALAVAAIYLAAREVGVKVEGEWWGVFDVEREDLGFLVVGLLSTKKWVEIEGKVGMGRWEVEDVEEMLRGGEGQHGGSEGVEQ